MKRKYLLLLLSGFIIMYLTGCGPSNKEIAKADYGPYPENHQKIIRDFFARITIDPDPNNTHIKYEEPIEGYMQNTRESFSKYEYGWIVSTWVNSKNSYGGYTGERPYKFLIRNNQIVLLSSIDIQGYYARPDEWR